MENEKRLTKKDIFSMFIRSNFLLGSFNFERVQAMGYCYVMIPAIKRLYGPGAQRNAALKRHLEWFNTHPWISAPIFGVTAAMEEEMANKKDFDEKAISGMKIGLMGPLAGVGDPIFWGTLRPVLAALGASLALGGNIAGPLLFFILINAIRLSTKYYGLKYGYLKGTEILKDLVGNRIQKLTEGASILGLFVMGALVSKWTTINIPVVVSRIKDDSGKVVVKTVQDVLDSILPGLLPLALTLLVAWMLRKGTNPLLIIFGIFLIGIGGYWIGFLG
ncbi:MULTISPECIES: mannose/fructose/sorbose PTS transporter subunit IID [Priestia]|jgi:fructose PTS system EIID component|uniref:Phosphotransferase system (PTS) fructose-specific enzyme IID component n=7 Tax=Priestia TaxID=2800373 RepID=D5E2J6_PRIM1|nr:MULTISPECIES: mannose/fructose/sorbose PTS transporter subunit IID [Priestia]AVX07657.1 PTS mannose transporter subunit IID [Bacillus sp. Y-01]KOP73844.1 PTS mannose transporter subunit IID [Bacillus sp. FJAT-21351]KQU26431.1 PTS mannose transporter subunit IID [Bacillus sp. Leaf75]KRD84126.1 PTS mannose transporter subunit IID [Bacillus sp. Root147]KRE10923.1 PTS mannose transporter subunit IID [Bacillus sp. Root239]KRF53476.1 PTS mannose transporter subunit IID [Bacillus sp. Soil531]MBK